jgi:hypothetical protein
LQSNGGLHQCCAWHCEAAGQTGSMVNIEIRYGI